MRSCPTPLHVIVQLDRPVTGALRAALLGAGISLQGYLGENAFFATLAPQGVDGIALAPGPNAMGPPIPSLATFRAIAKRYPEREHAAILDGLVRS